MWAALACAARPTAALLWLPLVLHQVLCCDPTAGARRRLILRYMCVGGGALAACSLLDSLCHGEPLLTPWRFLRANVLRDVGSWYGEHPWHWYMTVGLPSVLGAYALPCALAAFETVRRPAERRADLLLLATAAFVVAVLSVLPHKELRFLSPVLPCALHLSAGRLSRWSRRAPRVLLWLAAGTLLLANVLPAAYLGSVHQRGTLLAMRPLAELAAARPNDTSILFLMPCHSAPMYSHLHVNVPVRFLTCEPPPPGDLPPAEKYTDEAERFYERPSEWLHAEYPAHGSLPLPSHIVMFDTLAAKPGPASLLSRYRLLHSFPHSPTPISSRHGHQVLVHQHRDY